VAPLLLGRPQPDEMRSIFAGLGLGGDFWNSQPDSFRNEFPSEFRPLTSDL